LCWVLPAQVLHGIRQANSDPPCLWTSARGGRVGCLPLNVQVPATTSGLGRVLFGLPCSSHFWAKYRAKAKERDDGESRCCFFFALQRPGYRRWARPGRTYGTVGTSAAVPSSILPGRASQRLEITTTTVPSEIQRMSRLAVISSFAPRSSSTLGTKPWEWKHQSWPNL
jgi:hypothetical protein